MAFEKSVGAVVFRKEKNKILYLLIQHPGVSDDKEGGHWDFPKGHMEKGETWEDTLRREVEEETGITKLRITPGFYTWIRYFYRAKGTEKSRRRGSGKGINIFKIVTYYLAETAQKEVKLSFEHVDYAWLEYKQAIERITYQKSKKVLEKGHAFLLSNVKPIALKVK
ncbi:MAG: NUDIX domain-containing protein [Parcubacteria group bacterium]|jgi:8-oxo-dGTP pyrophosphatase MutT (NUDIX family)